MLCGGGKFDWGLFHGGNSRIYCICFLPPINRNTNFLFSSCNSQKVPPMLSLSESLYCDEVFRTCLSKIFVFEIKRDAQGKY